MKYNSENVEKTVVKMRKTRMPFTKYEKMDLFFDFSLLDTINDLSDSSKDEVKKEILSHTYPRMETIMAKTCEENEEYCIDVIFDRYNIYNNGRFVYRIFDIVGVRLVAYPLNVYGKVDHDALSSFVNIYGRGSAHKHDIDF